MEHARTCLGCRSRAARSELLRVVVRAQRLVIDESSSLTGRGAWLHPTVDCLESALERRAFARSFRQRIEDDQAVRGFVRQLTGDHSPAPNEKADRTMDNS